MCPEPSVGVFHRYLDPGMNVKGRVDVNIHEECVLLRLLNSINTD